MHSVCGWWALYTVKPSYIYKKNLAIHYRIHTQLKLQHMLLIGKIKNPLRLQINPCFNSDFGMSGYSRFSAVLLCQFSAQAHEYDKINVCAMQILPYWWRLRLVSENPAHACTSIMFQRVGQDRSGRRVNCNLVGNFMYISTWKPCSQSFCGE